MKKFIFGIALLLTTIISCDGLDLEGECMTCYFYEGGVYVTSQFYCGTDADIIYSADSYVYSQPYYSYMTYYCN